MPKATPALSAKDKDALLASYMISIEKDVPVPTTGGTTATERTNKMRNAMLQMKVGDSFEIPKDYCSDQTPRTAAKWAGIKITLRNDKKKNTVRIWRVE